MSVVEPDADNAKCMVRGHDYTPEVIPPDDVDRESPICSRCSAPKPGVNVWVHGYAIYAPVPGRERGELRDVLLVEYTQRRDGPRFELWVCHERVELGRMSHYRDGGTREWETPHGRLVLWRRMNQTPWDKIAGFPIEPHARPS